jgi:hypothetical protein
MNPQKWCLAASSGGRYTHARNLRTLRRRKEGYQILSIQKIFRCVWNDIPRNHGVEDVRLEIRCRTKHLGGKEGKADIQSRYEKMKKNTQVTGKKHDIKHSVKRIAKILNWES